MKVTNVAYVNMEVGRMKVNIMNQGNVLIIFILLVKKGILKVLSAAHEIIL